MRILGAGAQQGHRGTVVLFRRLLDRGLEPLTEVDDEVGVEDLVDLVGIELEVVRLGARGGEVRDVDPVTSDALRRVRDRIEGGDHRPLRGRRRDSGHEPEHERGRRHRRDPRRQPAACLPENHSQ